MGLAVPYDARMRLAELTFAPVSESVSAARRFTADTLSQWSADGLVWTAQQVVSELATNAVLHAATEFVVVLSFADDVLRIEVRDQSARAPRQRHYGRDATTGRGLTLVATLARAWGVQHDGDGKHIWCELAAELDDSEAEIDLDSFLSADDALSLGEQRSPRDRAPGETSSLRLAA